MKRLVLPRLECLQAVTRALRTVCACGALVPLSLATPARATRIDTGFIVPEPFFHHSFVRGANRLIVAIDAQYAQDVNARIVAANGTRYSTVDIVMQQCFGGGFLNELRDLPGPVNHTFASAAAWSEVAWSRGPQKAAVPKVDNFTRAWREGARAGVVAANGLWGYYQAAILAPPPAPLPAPPNGKDLFAPPPAGANFEHPQYESPDALAPPMGANDGRTLIQPPPGGARQFALLVQWSRPEPRFAINIARVYDTLTAVYGVSVFSIAVLYDNPAPALLGPWPAGVLPSDAGGLGFAPVDGANTRANWLAALNGTFFANQPVPGDKLLIYNTGHGGHAIILPFGFAIEVKSGTNSRRRWRFRRLGGFDTSVPDLGETDTPDNTDPDDNDLVDGSFVDYVDLSFATTLDPSLNVSINDTAFGSVGAIVGNAMANGLTPQPLDPFVTSTPATSLVVPVPHALLGSNDDLIIDLTGDAALLPDESSSLVAADVYGGDQEFLALNSGGGCSATPLAGCTTPQKSVLLIKDKEADGAGPNDKLNWKWIKGPSTNQADFGAPTATANYSLCLYTGTAQTLAMEVKVPPAGDCGGAPCWKALTTKGYKRKDSAAAADGVFQILLKGGAAGKSKILVKGRNENLDLHPDTLPLDEAADLIVQLSNSDNGNCWQGTFPNGSVKKNTDATFKAQAP